MSDLTPRTLPLANVRVLAIEQYGAGPWATMQLADLGAEVVKIEDPATSGDVGRLVPPYQVDDDSLFFETFNGGKKSIELDLRNPSGRLVFERLVGHSDVVFSNLRGDLPAKLGLRYADLAAFNSRLVCCALTGYGMDGPRAASGALDYVIQARAGWMSVTGDPDTAPTRAGLSLVDFSGGYVAAIAVLAGINRAQREGRGCDCDISLNETALSLLTYLGTWVATEGYVPVRQPQSAHPSIVPFQNFRTLDGWIVIACPKQELWERLCRVIDRPDLLGDERFADIARRSENRKAVVAELERTLMERGTEEWLIVLDAAGVPAGPINDIGTALRDEQVRARDGIESYRHELFGEVKRLRSPLRLTGPRKRASRAPRRGEHAEELLTSLCGFEEQEIRDLADRGAFGANHSPTGARRVSV